ncbi:MAG: fused MFS/spermidine synthase [Bifidobacteriaceae bacterium]|jgi:spermidine synthase|nr:fused MFS/spermidine synthase [Bifidobacteriaceae bacterium]
MVAVMPSEPFQIDTGTALFVQREDGVTLYINGVPSSQWSIGDPAELEFEYMRWMLAALRAIFPPDEPLRALHLGAAACALPRAMAHLWPRSRHLAVEIDAALAAAVRRHLDLPRAPVLRLRVADAVAALKARPPGSHHVIIRDAFDAQVRPPAGLTDSDGLAAAAAALRPDGLYLANCVDLPLAPRARLDLRALAAHFSWVGLATEPPILRGRHRGNVVLLARHEPPGERAEAALERALRSEGFPAALLPDGQARRWAGLG